MKFQSDKNALHTFFGSLQRNKNFLIICQTYSQSKRPSDKSIGLELRTTQFYSHSMRLRVFRKRPNCINVMWPKVLRRIAQLFDGARKWPTHLYQTSYVKNYVFSVKERDPENPYRAAKKFFASACVHRGSKNSLKGAIKWQLPFPILFKR